MGTVPEAQEVLVADVSSVSESFRLAELANRTATFDAVIHNVAVFQRDARALTADGFAPTFAINTLAPYVLTATMSRPRRLIYLSSGMHVSGVLDFDDLPWARRKWDGTQAYSDSKLHDTMLAFAVARCWPDVFSNAVDPGWVATNMGGSNAPGDVDAGSATQAWLASSSDPAALVSGKLFHHNQPRDASADARNARLQDQLLDRLAEFTGVRISA